MTQRHDHHDHAAADHAGHDHAHAGHAQSGPAAGGDDHSGHSHDGHSHDGQSHAGHSHAGHSHGSSSERRTAIAAVITFAFMLAEAAGGILSGSLALLADAAHMLTDAGSLALAWWAFRQASRPASAVMSFGHHRLPVLIAFANGIVLLLVTAWIVVEAVERLANPVEVEWQMMSIIAAAGLAANIAAFFVLSGGERNLNIRGALLHVASDMLGSVGALLAAAVIAVTGWMTADPVLSLVVSALLLRATMRLIKDSAHILLQGTPDGIDGPTLAADLAAEVPGVLEVHHVHIWTLAEGRIHATLHVVAEDPAAVGRVIRDVKQRLAEAHGISHATVEVERPAECADGPSVPVTVSE